MELLLCSLSTNTQGNPQPQNSSNFVRMQKQGKMHGSARHLLYVVWSGLYRPKGSAASPPPTPNQEIKVKIIIATQEAQFNFANKVL